MLRWLALGLILTASAASAQDTPTSTAAPDKSPAELIPLPALTNWQPLPPRDEEFSKELEKIVIAAGLDQMTPADKNPDKEDEWSSICLVDFSDRAHPRVAGWKEDNFLYPASTYKMYVVGEAIRQVVAGTIKIDDKVTVKENNIRTGTALKAGQEVTVSEILRLVTQESDNSAANEAIDLVDRRRASALMRALGCEGSDVTRKFLPRDREDAGYKDIASTTTNAQHLATFLWAVETGAIGGGRGRGLIKGYLGMNQTALKRFRAGLPASATLYSKTGTWNIFTSEAGIIEDGDVRYILCALTAVEDTDAEAKLAALTKGVHELLSHKTSSAGDSAKD